MDVIDERAEVVRGALGRRASIGEALVLHENGLVAVAEQMPPAAVTTVETPRVGTPNSASG